MDNGRSRILAHPMTRQSLACIRCGACLNVCPVYQEIGGHAYGSVYAGPIGAVITPQLFGIERAAQLPYASSLCGACRDACPVKIDIPGLLLHLRAEVTLSDPGGGRRSERLAFRAYAMAMRHPNLLGVLSSIARRVQRVMGASKGITQATNVRVAPALGAWTAWRDLRPLAPRSFREIWKTDLAGEE
jgi:L-lactate dehydrogenase complex protein LldF